MFLLMTTGEIYYYNLNSTNNSIINKNGSNLDNISNNHTRSSQKDKLIHQSHLPQEMLLWVEKVKSTPVLMVCHPIMFEVLLIFNDNLKFHFYNYEKLFQSHHILNIKNCKAASYSPLGDKLAIGMNGSIWLMDSYSHEIVRKIPLVIFPKSIIKAQEST